MGYGFNLLVGSGIERKKKRIKLNIKSIGFR